MGKVMPTVDENDRDSLIAWLAWNDRNGLYTDDDCDAEGWPRMTLQDALICYRDQSAEPREN
jgi:hypothetical protein